MGLGPIIGIAIAGLSMCALMWTGCPAATGPEQDQRSIDQLYAEFRPLLAREIETREIVDPADLYKFLYQGVLGPSHAVISLETARRWLENEWGQLGEPVVGRSAGPAVKQQPLIESVRPDGFLVRLNLAPLWHLVIREVEQDNRPETGARTREILARAFAETAEQWTREPDTLQQLWHRVVEDVSLWQGRFPAAEIEELTAALAAAGWPAVHHSEVYRDRWQPHYRVLAVDLLPGDWLRAHKETR